MGLSVEDKSSQVSFVSRSRQDLYLRALKPPSTCRSFCNNDLELTSSLLLLLKTQASSTALRKTGYQRTLITTTLMIFTCSSSRDFTPGVFGMVSKIFLVVWWCTVVCVADQSMFRNLDTDDDGVLSPSEMAKLNRIVEGSNAAPIDYFAIMDEVPPHPLNTLSLTCCFCDCVYCTRTVTAVFPPKNMIRSTHLQRTSRLMTMPRHPQVRPPDQNQTVFSRVLVVCRAGFPPYGAGGRPTPVILVS